MEEVEGLALGDSLEGESPEEGSLLVHRSWLFQLLVAVVTEVPIDPKPLFLLVFTGFCTVSYIFPIFGHRVGFYVLG